MNLPGVRERLILDNLKRVNEKIDSAAQRSGRDVREISLVVVSKTWSPDVIKYVVGAGIKDLGENKIQEAIPKIEYFEKGAPDLSWHMIGHLQSNKAKLAVTKFSLIQSVDSLKLARKISNAAIQLEKTVDFLIEVNISRETAKFGIQPEGLPRFIDEIQELPNIHCRGIMTIGPLTTDVRSIRQAFNAMWEYFRDLRDRKYPGFDILSMGMTDDYEIAIEEGSNMLRLGRAIFGPRTY
ncbi:MAG TPA: YggS family pyridoxal phosphate-dependent enzyme [Candidatus Marinimicrobia bacterium]|nr:YggS family pyridoxal phosphate-dependent enzyme [Candidatus Neomarinimicrobiota bacterium]